MGNFSKHSQLAFAFAKSSYEPRKVLILNRNTILSILSEILDAKDLTQIKKKILVLRNALLNPQQELYNVLHVETDSNANNIVSFRKDVFISELDKVIRSQTIERARHYLKRLKDSLQLPKVRKDNDLNLLRWKEYDEIITDSLWIIDKRDTSGAHLGWYWGNFIPQIPRQMMLRYTKKGHWVLDLFAGSGTTLIECRRLGRNGIGIELNQEVAEKARELIEKEQNKDNVITELVVGDSRTVDIKSILSHYGIEQVQLIIMHPPYHDIIKFSNDDRDLSNAKNTEEFLNMFGDVVDNATPFLEKGRYLVLVIGDKYSKGEWIPLGFYSMQEILKRGYLLKSIIVKNFEQTRGKRNQEELWRYRALVGGFYVFKHEYIMVFQKGS